MTKIARDVWSHKALFFLSCLGFAVGLGNIWRFPYLCYKNGGGAFLIPYVISVIFGGIPIFVLEVAIGQLTSSGGIEAWNISPAFKGIGIATTIVCSFSCIYYIIILAWTLHYFFNSFAWHHPWSSCGNAWNTANCTTGLSNSNESGGTVDAATEYWWRKVLQKSDGIDDVKFLNWELTLCLGIMWLIVYFVVWKGIKSSGKVVAFTALFPYAILGAFFVRAVTLDGAADGIWYFLRPDFNKLMESGVWLDAGTQVFYSYAIAIGSMTALGSYNNFHHDFLSDCLTIAAINSGTSFFAGFAIFSVLGFMAKENGVPIADVAESGPGLAFIVFPKAMSQMPLAPVWSVLFFLMLLTMGIDSHFVGLEGFITAVVDCIPTLRAGRNRIIFTAVVCFVMFLLGLPMVTDGGIYVFQLMDYYSASGMVLLWLCFWQSLAVVLGYGLNNFWRNIIQMRGPTVHKWLKFCWAFATPLFTLGVLVFMISVFHRLRYNNTYLYPIWAESIGILIAIIPMIIVPVYCICTVFRAQGKTLKQKWKNGTTAALNESLQKKLSKTTTTLYPTNEGLI